MLTKPLLSEILQPPHSYWLPCYTSAVIYIFTRMVFSLNRITRRVRSENILFTKWMFSHLPWEYKSNKMRVIVHHVRDIQQADDTQHCTKAKGENEVLHHATHWFVVLVGKLGT